LASSASFATSFFSSPVYGKNDTWFRICNDVKRVATTSESRVSGIDRLRVGEVPRGEKMLYSGTDPESYITEYALVYEDQPQK